MADLASTQVIRKSDDKGMQIQEVLKHVKEAMKQKGYDPISQMVGYIMSGDPTYITSYDNARSMILKVERDEILEELLKNYLGS